MIYPALFIIALLLSFLLSIPAMIHTIIGAIRWKGRADYVKDAFYRGAHAIDVFGNVAYATLLNDWFIKRGGHHYGNSGETISSATGKNWVRGTLTWIGLGLCGTLNWIDTDHCWKYIEGDRGGAKPDAVKWWFTALFILVAGGMLAGLVWFWWWVI